MKILDDIAYAAKLDRRRIVLAEGEDVRVVQAAVRAVQNGIANIILVGNTARVRKIVLDLGHSPSFFHIEDPLLSSKTLTYADEYYELRKHKMISSEDAIIAVHDPVGFAAMMVRKGDADGMVAGAVATTAHTVRTAVQILGPASDTRLVSSFFLMLLDELYHEKKGAFVFADCALVVDPDAEQMAEIAVASARSFESIAGVPASVAMLSFSTMSSARHVRVDKVVRATELAKAMMPGLRIDGEIQFDAAFVPSVQRAKTPSSPLMGDANVFVFPSLEAGNIGYKIAQRIGGAVAVGPILQGLAKPANDLSRGCSSDDVFHVIAITALQAEGLANKMNISTL